MMLPSAVPQQELHKAISEIQALLNNVKQQGQEVHNKRMLDSLYRLKAKATEAIELLKSHEAPATKEPVPYQGKLHRLYERL
jgi:hypothetical protein